MKEEKANKLTIKIIEVILKEQNGYTDEEIKEGNLAQECEGSELFQEIQKVLINTK
jgi:hypothetical protein